MAKKKRSKPHEEEVGEAWLLPYSDLMTLLLALFIALFAMSQTDQTKMAQMAQAFSAAFNMGGPSFFDKAGPSESRMEPIPSTEDKGNDAYIRENQQLEDIKHQVDQYIAQNNLEMSVTTQMTEEGLMLRIKERALFASGSATLGNQAQSITVAVASILGAVNQRVIISGHTDNVPIANTQFPSNWELSSTRAVTFMRSLLATNAKLSPKRFSAIGYSEYRPIADNATEQGRTENRRVEVLIARNLRFDPGETQKSPAGIRIQDPKVAGDPVVESPHTGIPSGVLDGDLVEP